MEEFEHFNNEKLAQQVNLNFESGKSSVLSRKQKDKKQMALLTKYLNFSLMKLNDSYVQSRYKNHLK